LVSFQQATLNFPPDEAKLSQAAEWYSRSLKAPDQPAAAYIPIKAAFGLGQVHMAGYQAGMANWSEQQARQSFSEVINSFDSSQNEALTEMAGHAHAYLGWLAGNSNDWPRMADEFYKAIALLNSAPGYRPDDWVAYYWSLAALAEEHQNNLVAAREAYLQAVTLAEQINETRAFTPENLEEWRANLNRLSKGNP
jgi:tetratricopeptide (TPR) repeat protein